MPTISYPYNPLAIVAPDLADDNKFKQYIEFIKQCFIQAGGTELTDSGYLQQWYNSGAGSTVSNANAGTNAGGTNNSNMSQYPNLAMDNSTSSYWQSAGQPILGGAGYSVLYDSGAPGGVANSVSANYYNLWLQGSQNSTDPYSFVVEHAAQLDTNYDWAGSGWVPVHSVVNLNTTAGALSVASVSLSAVSGTGYIVNTTATVGTGGGASTTTTATFAITSGNITIAVTASASFAVGQYIQINDGTHNCHFVITAINSGTSMSVTFTPVAGDATSGTMGTAATLIQAGIGAVIQPVITSGAVSSNLIANPGLGYHVGDVINYQVASVGSGAAATVSSVNAAGMILATTVSAGGSAYVANPTATASGGTGSCLFAVFTNAAIGVSGAIQQVVPCVSLVGSTYQSGGGGYAYGTPPTVTIAQASGGSSPTGAGTPTAKLTMSTGNAAQLNRFDICTQFWSSLSTATGPVDRAFRLRVLANNGSTTSVNIYEWQIYNAAGTYVNNTPSRLAPTSSQTSTYIGWKIFCFADAIQTASGSSGCPLYMKIWFGNAGTWNYPSFQIALGQGTDGAGNLVGPQVTATMTVSGAAGSTTVAPIWACGNTDWFHITLFKSTNAEVLIHIERNQASATNGTDSAANGVTLACANTAGSQSVVMPQYGASPGIESSWGAILGIQPGSQDGPQTQGEMIRPRNLGWLPPLRRMWVVEKASGFPDGSSGTMLDPYGNSISYFVDGNLCTKVLQGGSATTGRACVKAAV